MIHAKVWGPHVWYWIHTMTFQLPQTGKLLPLKKRKELNAFFKVLLPMLPCPSCRKHYEQTLQYYPVTVNRNGRAYARWAILAHNLVNKAMGKTLWDYQMGLKTYSKPVKRRSLYLFFYYMIVLASATLSVRKTFYSLIAPMYPHNKVRAILVASQARVGQINTKREWSLVMKELLAKLKKVLLVK